MWFNNVLVATAEQTCIKGLTRNPDLAREFAHALPLTQIVWGDGDVVLKLFARIGTPQSTCGGHASAAGLRVYYDAADRDSRFDLDFEPGN